MLEKPIYAVGLDVGSTRTRMVVCAVEERLRLLGCSAAVSAGCIVPSRFAVALSR